VATPTPQPQRTGGPVRATPAQRASAAFTPPPQKDAPGFYSGAKAVGDFAAPPGMADTMFKSGNGNLPLDEIGPPVAEGPSPASFAGAKSGEFAPPSGMSPKMFRSGSDVFVPPPQVPPPQNNYPPPPVPPPNSNTMPPPPFQPNTNNIPPPPPFQTNNNNNNNRRPPFQTNNIPPPPPFQNNNIPPPPRVEPSFQRTMSQSSKNQPPNPTKETVDRRKLQGPPPIKSAADVGDDGKAGDKPSFLSMFMPGAMNKPKKDAARSSSSSSQQQQPPPSTPPPFGGRNTNNNNMPQTDTSMDAYTQAMKAAAQNQQRPGAPLPAQPPPKPVEPNRFTTGPATTAAAPGANVNSNRSNTISSSNPLSQNSNTNPLSQNQNSNPLNQNSNNNPLNQNQNSSPLNQNNPFNQNNPLNQNKNAPKQNKKSPNKNSNPFSSNPFSQKKKTPSKSKANADTAMSAYDQAFSKIAPPPVNRKPPANFGVPASDMKPFDGDRKDPPTNQRPKASFPTNFPDTSMDSYDQAVSKMTPPPVDEKPSFMDMLEQKAEAAGAFDAFRRKAAEEKDAPPVDPADPEASKSPGAAGQFNKVVTDSFASFTSPFQQPPSPATRIKSTRPQVKDNNAFDSIQSVYREMDDYVEERNSKASPEERKFAFWQKFESWKCVFLGSGLSLISVAPFTFLHYFVIDYMYTSAPQWEFDTEAAAIQGAFFGLVYRYALREDAGKVRATPIKNTIFNAFVWVRALSRVHTPMQCTSLPLQCTCTRPC
jgi:hypothetical protein